MTRYKSRGRITLVGDAAHRASRMAGLGTTMAIIGAYVLAGELHAANGDHTQAFPPVRNRSMPKGQTMVI